MNYQALVIAQIVIDIFFIVCLSYIILSSNKKNKVVEEKRIKGLFNHLEKEIKAANSVARGISKENEKGIKSSRELLNVLERKKVELHDYLERIDSTLKAIDEVLPAGGESHDPKLEGRYLKAAKLAEEGCSADEIVKRVGLPKGEVMLIMELKKR